MQIVCPNCTTAYDITPGSLGSEGRAVRCARCRTVWTAKPAAGAALAIVGPMPGADAASVLRAPAALTPAMVDDDADDSFTAAGGAPAADDASAFDWSLRTDGYAGRKDAAAPAPDAPPAGSQDAVDDIFANAGGFGEHMDEPPDAPSLVPAAIPDPAAHPEPDNIEAIAARRAPRPKTKRQWLLGLRLPGLPGGVRGIRIRGGMAMLVAALAIILAGLGLGRQKVVAWAPQTASLYRGIGLPVNLRGLEFEDVKTTGEMHEGVPVLIVEGTLTNVTTRPVDVPRLRFAMRNRAGQEIYAWTSVSGRSSLAPGETAPFRTRLASPPADGREVSVRFFNRRDALAGMR